MRFYRITLTDKDDKPLKLSSLSGSDMGDGIITSLKSDGTTNSNALNVEIDITQYWQHQAGGDSRSYVRIWGLSLTDVIKSFNFAGGKITVEAGMAKGYPLADPNQQGVLVKGSILQAFGNWLGTEMTLDLIIGPSDDTPTSPGNYTFHLAKGEKISKLISGVIGDVFPNMQSTVSISPDRVAKQALDGHYQTFTQFAQQIYEQTRTPGKDDGVVIAVNGKKVNVNEHPDSEKKGDQSETPVDIKFQDLLGQVTWFAVDRVSAKLVMRGDLDPNQLVTFPKGLVSTVTAASMPGFGGATRDRDSLSFSGQFRIFQMQHWGNFRIPDAMSWNTSIWCGLDKAGASNA